MMLDWLAAVLNVVGLYCLPKKRMIAMYFFVASSLVFLVWAAIIGSEAVVLLQVVLMVLNIRTILIWRKDES